MKAEKLKINSIRSKLIISLIGICMIPLLILGFGSYMQSKAILNEKLKVTSQQTLSEVNDGINNYFNGFSSLISMLVSNDNITNSNNVEQYSSIPGLLKNLKESNRDISSVYFGTSEGEFQIYPNDKMPDGYDPRTRPWYKEALENRGKITITLPYIDSQKGNYTIAIARAVEKNGKIVGVCGIDVSIDTLVKKIGDKKVGNTGYVFVSDVEGKSMIAHQNKELIGTDAASTLSIWNEVKLSEKGFISYDYNNAKKFGAYATNQVTGWKLLATIEEKEISNDMHSILVTTLIITLIIGFISIWIAWLLSKGISHNIKKLKDGFGRASNGDLTVFINTSTKDEFMDLANSFNSMMKNISELMSNITLSSKTVLETSSNLASMSEEVTASVGEVARAIEEVSEGATNQAQNAQNGVEEISMLSNKLDEISANSNEMDKLSLSTRGLSSEGLSMIDTLIEKSNKTKISTNEVNDIVEDMNDSTKKISSISETIAQITEQTNLLSLNASIESARAGEAGKGFAVVAEEIRKLAEQSKESTEEIKVIISNIQKKSDAAVVAIKVTENVVNEQETAVNKTQEIFSKILKSIEEMINKVDEVKSSIIAMDKKKESVVIEIENISSISEETASATEEVTASTEEISAVMNKFTKYADELQDLAEKLDSELEKFIVN